MPIYEIEVTRTVEYKGFVRIEAADENAAHDPAKAQVDAGLVPLEKTLDCTDLGPVYRLEE
jgi:hypothetical protein